MILFAAFKEFCIPSPQELKLTFLSWEDPSNFHCRPADHQKKYTSMLKKIQHYIANENKRFDLSVSMDTEQPVLAQHPKDNQWYRATVKADTADTTSVFYIDDFGNRETLPSSDLRFIPNKFLSLPRLKLSCSLYDVQPCSGGQWSEESIDCFRELVKKEEFVEARVVKILGNSCLEVSLRSKDGKDFAEHLIDKGHAERKQLQSSSSRSPPIELTSSM